MNTTVKTGIAAPATEGADPGHRAGPPLAKTDPLKGSIVVTSERGADVTDWRFAPRLG